MEITALKNKPLPDWFKQAIPPADVLAKIRLLKEQGVNTVCQEAGCPNLGRCISANTLTFLILGDTCTRRCKFCRIGVQPFRFKRKQRPACDNDFLDQEPKRVLEAIKKLGLQYAVITSVTRDDLADRGASQFVRVINAIRDYNKNIKIEVLIPDLTRAFLVQVLRAMPDVLGHNLETVRRLYPQVRNRASYRRSLEVLAESKRQNPRLITKSSLLLGMSETRQELYLAMDDLRGVGCDILVLGQYLAPSPRHYPVKEFISTACFQEYKIAALKKGFSAVLALPLARTSYQAREVYEQVTKRKRFP